MKPTHIDFKFSDFELAKALGDAAPPDGLQVSVAEHPTMRASAGADVVLSVSLHFSHTNLVLIAAWVAREVSQYLKTRQKERTRINDQEVLPTQEEVLRLMREVIHWQQVREAQFREMDEKKRLQDKKSKCPEMMALTFPLDRGGELSVDGVVHSTGLFHTHLRSGLYVQSIQHSPNIPNGTAIVLLADDGERFEIERIYPCPNGEAHLHLEIDVA
jgi:hypothetical protein